MVEKSKEISTELTINRQFFSGIDAVARFVLVRHGESEGNAAGIFQGRSEYALSDRGREQAAALGLSLARHRGARVLCSPLSRARETAEIAARAAGFSVPVVTPELTELETGSFTGRSWDDIRHNETEKWHSFRTLSWEGVEGAERCAELYARAERAWAILRETARAAAEKAPVGADGKKNVCVIAVSHGGFLQWLVRVTFGAKSWFPLIPIENCCAYCLRTEPVDAQTSALFWETMGEKVRI